MQPVTDRHQVSRAKLSYLIDATAAPICIIAPISSWAAAVTGFVEGEDGFSIFMRAIPYNFYALLTILMMIAIVVMKFDFGTMRTHEKNAVKGDIFTTANRPYESGEEIPVNENGKVTDLLIPIASLIVCCVIGMIYTGGFFDGVDFVTAFSNSDASVGLVLGSFFGLVLTIGLYCVRKVLTFKECMECIPEGFKAMVPAIMILTFAWTLKAMTDSLGAAAFVAMGVNQFAEGLMNFLPAIIFLIGCFLAFAGAQCDHVTHVSTQLPYVITAALVSFVTYIIAGFVQSAWIALPVGIGLMIVTLMVIKKKTENQE